MFPARSAPAAAPKSARKGGEPISQAPATAAGPSGANPACPAAANRNASAVSSARETPNARRRGSTAARSLCSVSVMIHPSPMRCVRLMIHACPQKGCRTNVIKMRESCNALTDISGYIPKSKAFAVFFTLWYSFIVGQESRFTGITSPAAHAAQAILFKQKNMQFRRFLPCRTFFVPLVSPRPCGLPPHPPPSCCATPCATRMRSFAPFSMRKSKKSIILPCPSFA